MDPPVTFFFNQGRPILSLEFSPPKTQQNSGELLDTAELIATHLKPDWVCMADSQDGAPRELAYLHSQLLRERFGWTAAPQLGLEGRTQEELLATAENYLRMGIRNVECLGGEQVGLLKTELPDLCLGIIPAVEEDALRLKDGVDCGASWIITQPLSDTTSYKNFATSCQGAGIRLPLIPAVIPAVVDETLSLIEGLLALGAPGIHLLIGDNKSAIELIRKINGKGFFKRG